MIQGNKDCPLDPRKLQDLAMRTGDAVNLSEAHDNSGDQDREVITKEADSKNKTLQKMIDDLKSDEEHQNGLQIFLTEIFKQVGKQAEDLRNFQRPHLQQFVSLQSQKPDKPDDDPIQRKPTRRKKIQRGGTNRRRGTEGTETEKQTRTG